MKCILSVVFGMLVCNAAAVAEENAVGLAAIAGEGAKMGEWSGFARADFEVDGRACIVVAPKDVAAGKPWIWRARFFGHEPQTDLALLAKGFHLVYMDVSNLYGAPVAVGHWDEFYAHLVGKHGFAKKAVLEGMSRGGLIIFNWAKANPEKVACIYGDAPVCDIRSWPGGKGAGKGSKGDWERCMRVYGITEDGLDAFKGNPIDGLEPLAKAGVPILIVCGAADDLVPMAENTNVLKERFESFGGSIRVIAKEGVGHHPHSLKDPKEIVDFITGQTKAE